jgi:oligoendopeptidase F
MKTEWNLGLLYKSAADPKIEADIKAYENAIESFEKKYKNKAGYQTDENKLGKALADYERLSGMSEGSRAIRYFHFRKDINGADQEAESEINKLTERLTKAGNKIVFFELALGKIDKKHQKLFLKSDALGHFRYMLERIFIMASHNLTEAEEKIMGLKSMPSRMLWTQGQQKLLGAQTVVFKGRAIPLPEAQNMITNLPTKDRRKLADDISKALKGISHFAESEMNAVILDKKINDELRGFAEPYSATILGYQNDEKSIINFINTVTKHFYISHAFYDLKAQLLKSPKLEYADRAAKAGDIKIKLTFDDAVRIYKKALSKLDQKYVTIFDRYLENGQIDVYPKKGKKGGAYCASDIGVPTFVMLNHVNTLDSLKTLAHEMGHAFHAEFSKSQPVIYQGHTISVAEVASTLFENFAFDEVFETLSEKEKIIALHDRLNDSISTIFRQVACFNYELEMHKAVRERGSLSKEEMAALHNKHMKAYLGPRFTMKEDDGYLFVSWPHLRYFFYVYSYAYGEIISKALYLKYKEDSSYMKQIERFLYAGGSKSPENIFKAIGIDTSKPEFFVDGLKAIEGDIKKLKKLIADKKVASV